MKTMVAVVFVLVTAAPAFAEWGLYANRDGKGFVMEKTFAFQKDCETAAREAWHAAQQKGAFGCVEYSATSFARPYYRSPQPSPEEPFGEKFRHSQQRQRQQELVDQQRRENERRRQELLQIERDRVRAIERANEIEQQRLDALRRYR